MDFSSNTDGKRKLPSVIPSGNPPWIAGFRVHPWTRKPGVKPPTAPF